MIIVIRARSALPGTSQGTLDALIPCSRPPRPAPRLPLGPGGGPHRAFLSAAAPTIPAPSSIQGTSSGLQPSPPLLTVSTPSQKHWAPSGDVRKAVYNRTARGAVPLLPCKRSLRGALLPFSVPAFPSPSGTKTSTRLTDRGDLRDCPI